MNKKPEGYDKRTPQRKKDEDYVSKKGVLGELKKKKK